MSKLMIGIQDAETNTQIIREMTDEEYAVYLESTTPQPAE